MNLTDTPNEYKRGFEDGQQYATSEFIKLIEYYKEYTKLLSQRESELGGLMVGRGYGQATNGQVNKGMELRKNIEAISDKLNIL